MILQLSLLLFIFFIHPPAFPSNALPRPDCPTRCGNLSIPYPFGVGEDCSQHPSFSIMCNSSTNSTKPYLSVYDHIEVIEITDSQIRVANPYLLNAVCYSASGERISTDGDGVWTGLSLIDTQYTFSDQNWLTAVGCDDLLLGVGELDQRFGGGCVSYCMDTADSHYFGYCRNSDTGNMRSYGCCHNPVPKGIRILGAQFTDLSNQWRKKKLFNCSYAFILEKPSSNPLLSFSYQLSYLNNASTFVDEYFRRYGTLPVIRLDWHIGSQNCSQARRNATYACAENSDCIDYDVQVEGYLCQCKDGYHGNPYIGCQDIDECEENPCDSNSNCINTPGSFTCTCPKWHYGDGRKDGKGCRPSECISIVVGISSGVGSLLFISMYFFWNKKIRKRNNKRRKEKFFKENGGLLLQKHTNEGIQRRTLLFSVEELAKATDNFNKSRIIGQGGQGRVYKGMLSDGNIVAIKKSKLVNKDQMEQFINEVVILSQINHKNVVKLLGCCLETEVPLLVYEFMPNGTLFYLIHDSRTEFLVSWNMRLKIATDIAGALMYLHSSSSRPIYHRDIKSSNILIDEKYVVKLSDFGISRFVSEDQTHLTTKVKGTFGYCDPEYYQTQQFTEKSDVYSFAVVLLELLTGQRAVSNEEGSLVTRFLESVEEDNLETILDLRVAPEGVKQEMIAIALLAQRCLNMNGKMRPTMKEVATSLEILRMSQVPAIVDHEVKAKGVGRAKSVSISNHEHSWIGSLISETSASSSNAFMLSNGKTKECSKHEDDFSY